MKEVWICCSALALGCAAATPSAGGPRDTAQEEGAFGADLAFLQEHLRDLVVLRDGDAMVAVAPCYQGRVMTSSANGVAGSSYGWINRELIASGKTTPHMNAFGGEDRFWLGPEGGPFALYFPSGAPFEFEHWQVPAPIDTEAWAVVSKSDAEVRFRHDMKLTNRAGNELSIAVDRTIRLVDPSEVARGAVQAVAYESHNVITNIGESAWTRESGEPSIWILSVYQPSPRTTVVVPFERSAEGPIVNAYFGEIPAERLHVDEARGVTFFRADGTHRSKIGVPRPRAREWMGSWDAERGALTLVWYTLPPGERPYVDSHWSDQYDPFAGDVVNSYNDGPTEPGGDPLGPFYELESSSPAAELAPGEQLEHIHRTFHIEGDRNALDSIAQERLGVRLDAIEAALP